MRRLLLILLAVPTVALAADVTGAQTGGQPAAAPPQAVANTPPPAPTLAVSTPPPTPSDPVNCRMSCANANYVCLAAKDPSDCSPTWSRCVATCDNPDLKPDGSSAPGAQTMTSP